MHSTDSQCPYLASDLDFTASCSHHGSLLCQDPQAQAFRASPFQICANPSFALWNQHHRRAPQPLTTKTKELGLQQYLHSPPHATTALAPLPRAVKVLDTEVGLWSHMPLSRPCSPPICKTQEVRPSISPTRTTWVSGFSSMRRWTSNTPATHWKPLMMSSWRQLMTPFSHVSATQALASLALV